MDRVRLASLLERFGDLTVLVIGDVFLDKYLELDRRLSEVSLETGLEAHQVIQVRCSPGAAGTAMNNLRALGVSVVTLGVIGDDGEGYELKRAVRAIGVGSSLLIECPDWLTPTYTKPMMHEPDGWVHEINRIDIKNRAPLQAEIEDRIIVRLREALPHVHGIVIADQVPEANCGVITERVRGELCAQARNHPGKAFVADSRERIGLFADVILKPNAREAVRAVQPRAHAAERTVVEACGMALAARAHRPVFVTVGEDGILVCDHDHIDRVSTRPASGPIDTVGAGDSVMAGLVSSLCAGASAREAAIVGNLVASVTIRQIGTTGTASPEQVLKAFDAANLTCV